jgi:hypothetical protein
MATRGVKPYADGALSLPASTRSGDEFEGLRLPAGTSCMRPQLVSVNGLPGAQEKWPICFMPVEKT